MAQKLPVNPDAQERIKQLKQRCAEQWEGILADSSLAQMVFTGEVTRKFCAMYLLETFHYTSHNARNQALVGVKAEGIPDKYRRYCFHHAEEETGHENMALHDLLSSVGIAAKDFSIPKPLADTEVLIAYLYWVSANGNPYRRLGYSFWAESCYEYLNPMLDMIRDTLGLKDSQMTFFRAHSDIDEDHAKEVEEMLIYCCRTDEDWEEVENVMKTSLDLTARMVEGVVKAYREAEGASEDKYAALNK